MATWKSRPDYEQSAPKVVSLDDERAKAAQYANKGYGNGGGGDGMDLISRVQNLEEMIGKIALELAEIKGKISNMPTTGQLVGITLGSMFGAVIATSGLVFTIVRLSH